jgi:hypothetical protein
MTLHPISIVDRVIVEYQNYLLTEFRARDQKLWQALESALTRPKFLAQEPFFQAHRPFKAGKDWMDLGLDTKLADVMREKAGGYPAYLHQSQAIDYLLSGDATALVVTTGTGSGKTECFLLPVIQNTIEDSVKFKKRGLTAILVYPMNALANDQEERIQTYLKESGHTHVRVARYDRSTKQDEREALRKNPPHILLTNYMMLEYLLVRPSDRDAIFANHRCRFIVLDEVHTYRGSLGANIALLVRRLKAHLAEAKQDWGVDTDDQRRFPKPVAVGTSATIKSVDETGLTKDQVRERRDAAVQEFFGKLTGCQEKSIYVVGEELRETAVPPEARWTAEPVAIPPPRHDDPEAVARAVAALAGLPPETPVGQAAKSAAILWKLNDLLVRKPLSISQIVEELREKVPERVGKPEDAVRMEVQAALVTGAALPDQTPGVLRLRTHRFIRGGWSFHRCVDPECGKLFPFSREECDECGSKTAPLYICRSCGSHTLRFKGDPKRPQDSLLQPHDDPSKEDEWFLYYEKDSAVDEEELEADESEQPTGRKQRTQMKSRPVVSGSFEPASGSFSQDPGHYPHAVTLAPARNTCLVCGGSAGAANLLTPVALGTSAAVRVLSEGLVEGLAAQNKGRPKNEYDGKDRLLIFADSRQDAAHQARFITYAGRYDRMRRRLVRSLKDAGKPLSLQETVRSLMVRGVELRDNEHILSLRDPDPEFLSEAVQGKALAWEEAPLLDDIAVSSRYRATVLNLGLVGVRYDKLLPYLEKKGQAQCEALGLEPKKLAHLCRCILDEMRTKGALSRPMLCQHPAHPSYPDKFDAANWERRIKSPIGYACVQGLGPVGHLDSAEIPPGVRLANWWRKEGKHGRGPAMENRFKELLRRLGGASGTETLLLDLVRFLITGGFIVESKLLGTSRPCTLLQLSEDRVQLELVSDEDRFGCSVCNVTMPWAALGTPCPTCHGELRALSSKDFLSNRYVQRILKDDALPLVAGEHTAQVTGDARIELESRFKASPTISPVNVLACSPTLEMGIDVGGLDAVVMRNVPPRPDNYAQRGGRAGRRSRVGIVLGYARSTPHDGYFYDKPGEMIAGEVPAPAVGLGNRDVVMRHLNAIAFGRSRVGLAGRMGHYVEVSGELKQAQIDELVQAVQASHEDAIRIAMATWEPEILQGARLDSHEAMLAALVASTAQTQKLFEAVGYQIRALDVAIENWKKTLQGRARAIGAGELKARLLGISTGKKGEDEADDRTAGHPMRRFAEFGILPGYEFPSFPATVRLLGDDCEEEPLGVARHFGLAQYVPGVPVHARGHKWKVWGLDSTSPWNPKSDEPQWHYQICGSCKLRFEAQAPSCPRCRNTEIDGKSFPAHEFGGFLATRNDAPVLEEEDRYSVRTLLSWYPQWNGQIVGRFKLPAGWQAELRERETMRWLNEWKVPSDADRKKGAPILHSEARGFWVCPSCGRDLEFPEEAADSGKGRKKTKSGADGDRYGHHSECTRRGQPPKPLGITHSAEVSTFRVLLSLPPGLTDDQYAEWGYSLGYALRIGLRQLHMLEGSEVEFLLEPMRVRQTDHGKHREGCLTFIDAAVGGSGFLKKMAEELHLVANRALEHLDGHQADCDRACYRCLKSYQNQRHHASLNWLRILADLELLAGRAPEKQPAHLGDIFDPRPWLEAFDAGVGSPLELKFLRLFEKHGIVVEKQVAITPAGASRPLTVADFAIVDRKIAIYVDGAAFHTGANLRRDRYIREKLAAPENGWTVVELRAKELGDEAGVVAKVRG